MKRILVALAAAAVLAAVPVGAEERLAGGSHLVTPDVAQARLLEAGAERQQNIATVEALIASPAGTSALATVGVSEARVRESLATLSDAELQDVAARAAALQADPVAGAMTTKTWIWIGVAVVAIVIIIIAVA